MQQRERCRLVHSTHPSPSSKPASVDVLQKHLRAKASNTDWSVQLVDYTKYRYVCAAYQLSLDHRFLPQSFYFSPLGSIFKCPFRKPAQLWYQGFNLVQTVCVRVQCLPDV